MTAALKRAAVSVADNEALTHASHWQDTTKTFKDVMTLRAENLKGNEDRRKLFTGTPDSASPFGGRQSASQPVHYSTECRQSASSGIQS